MDVKRRRIKEYLIEGDHVGLLGAHKGMHDPLCTGGVRTAKIHLCCSLGDSSFGENNGFPLPSAVNGGEVGTADPDADIKLRKQ